MSYYNHVHENPEELPGGEVKKSRVTYADVSKDMYRALHNLVRDAEISKTVSPDILEEAQTALASADRITELRTLVYKE